MHGADSNRRAELIDETPLSYAVMEGSFDTIKLLFEKGGDTSIEHGQLLHWAVLRTTSNDLEVLRYILDKGPPINHVQYQNDLNSYGQRVDGFELGTALHKAAEKGRLDMVKVLLGRGSDPLIRDCTGKLAVERAQDAGHTAVVDYLKPMSSGAERHECFTDQPWARASLYPIKTTN